MASDDDMSVMIGLEVHVQLTKLKSKMFCGCTSDYRGKDPNTVTCEVCLGLPGTLPVLNARAVDFAICLGLALNATIQPETFFFRKNYYYPDMAKNFQITQYDKAGGVPIAVGGCLTIGSGADRRVVHFSRIHMEEDPGRLTYDGSIASSPHALVDYNRHGCTLVECVTEPELRNPAEARAFLRKLRSIVEHLGIADLSLDGSMRCDANISYKGHARVEIKNISSMKEVERALNFEMLRQKSKIKGGGEIVQETRHWDETRRVTISLRTKETEKDYRYFPEPDLLPIRIAPATIEALQASMPELPDARVQRLVSVHALPVHDAGVLVDSKAMADFFEACIALGTDAKATANWLMGDVARRLNEDNLDISETRISPPAVKELLDLIDRGEITGKIGKTLVKDMLDGHMPSALVKQRDLKRIDDETTLESVVDEVVAEQPKAVADARDGSNPRSFEFLVGQVMKKTRGQADPERTRALLAKKVREA